MVCDRTLTGANVQLLAAEPQPFGPALDDMTWVHRVEVWYTEDQDVVDFTEFRVFDGVQRRKTVRVAGY
jgi:hypothetical protein